MSNIVLLVNIASLDSIGFTVLPHLGVVAGSGGSPEDPMSFWFTWLSLLILSSVPRESVSLVRLSRVLLLVPLPVPEEPVSSFCFT